MNLENKKLKLKLMEKKKKIKDNYNANVFPCWRETWEKWKDPTISRIVKEGGREAGKSHIAAFKVTSDLISYKGAEAFIVCLTSKHKNNMRSLYCSKLQSQGIDFFDKRTDDGEITIYFGNKNIITITSVKANSLDEMINKIKTVEPKNQISNVDDIFKVQLDTGTIIKRNVVHIIVEEFDGIVSYYKGISEAENALSSFDRHLSVNSCTTYIYNPPENKKHIVYEWLARVSINKNTFVHRSTLYDLPEDVRSEKGYQKAEELRVNNEKEWRHRYMGEPVGVDGLAFPTFTKDFGYEHITIPNGESVTSYDVVIDRGLQDACSMALYQRTNKGNVYLTDVYYHSCRDTGQELDDADYATRFDNWLKGLKVKYNGMVMSTLYIDGLALVRAVKKKGYRVFDLDKRKRKNQRESYRCLDNLIIAGRFKILNKPENMIAINQLQNAETEYKKYQHEEAAVIMRPDNTTSLPEHQIHSLDCSLYYAFNHRKSLGI